MKTNSVWSLVVVASFLTLSSVAHALECPQQITVQFSGIAAAPVDETMQKYPDLLRARAGVAAQSALAYTLTLFSSQPQTGEEMCAYHDNILPTDNSRVHYLWHRPVPGGNSGRFQSLTWLNTWLVTPTASFGIGLYLDSVSARGIRLKPVTPAGKPQLPQSLTSATLEDPKCEPIPAGDAGSIPCPTIWSTVGSVGRVELRTANR
jgi:hypothetical protein